MVGTSGQLFHIITGSSKEPCRGVVASKPLKRALFNWFLPYMLVSQRLIMSKNCNLKGTRFQKLKLGSRGQKVSALQLVSVQTLSPALRRFGAKPQA